MMISRNLIAFITLLASCSNISCTTKRCATEAEFNKDSLAADMLKANLGAMHHNTELKVHVPDHLLEGDTVMIKGNLSVDKIKNPGPTDFLMLDSNYFLIIRECNRAYCMFNVQSKRKEMIKDSVCYLPTRIAIKLVYEEVDGLKIDFYDTYQRTLRKYRRKLCQKYSITEDELDSLSFLIQPEMDQIRREFDIDL